MAIVKVQRPLEGNDPTPAHERCMVYAQHRRLLTIQRVPSEVWAVLRGAPRGKAYFEATYSDFEKKWEIGTQVGDKAW